MYLYDFTELKWTAYLCPTNWRLLTIIIIFADNFLFISSQQNIRGLSERTCWISLCFSSSSLRNTCLSVLPASNVCPSFLLALNTWGKHIWECSQTTEGDQSVCLFVCVCVCGWEMCLSVLGVSKKEKNADQAALWQMVHLHVCKLESLLHLEFLCAELHPKPQLCLQLKPSLHPVLSPTLSFCGSSIFRPSKDYRKL